MVKKNVLLVLLKKRKGDLEIGLEIGFKKLNKVKILYLPLIF